MKILSIYEAKTQLSKYVSLIETKKETSFVITKNGKPLAEIIPYVEKKERRIGIAKGVWDDVSENDFNDFDLLSVMAGGK